MGTMSRRRCSSGIVLLLLSLNTPAISADFTIDNPADRIKNPAGTMYNPASRIKNPAATIYNPAARMDNPNPLSPVSPPNPQPVVTKEVPATFPSEQLAVPPLSQAPRQLPHKNYHYKTVRAYVVAAKKAFSVDDYPGFLSITEDALRRLAAGTLQASDKTKQKLVKYRVFGYGLLGKDGE